MARRSGTGSSKLGHSTEVINSKVSGYEITATRIAINQWPSGPSYSWYIYIYRYTHFALNRGWKTNSRMICCCRSFEFWVLLQKKFEPSHISKQRRSPKHTHKSNKAGKNSLRMWRVRISLWCGRDLINIWFISRHRLSAQLVVFLYNIYINKMYINIYNFWSKCLKPQLRLLDTKVTRLMIQLEKFCCFITALNN